MQGRDTARNVAKGIALGAAGVAVFLSQRRRRHAVAELEAERRNANQLRTEQELSLIQARAELEAAAKSDSLTEIGNRRQLDESADLLWRRQAALEGSVAVLLVDIDEFRAFNEFRGNDIGDDCLRAVAKVLRMAASSERDQLVRYGGDKFLVVMPGAHEQAALRCAGRIHSLLRAEALPHPTSEVSERVTVSIGVSASPAIDGRSLDLLIGAAEEAVAAAKREGRNRTVLNAIDDRLALPDDAPLRIGLLAPFSGVVSMYGEEIHRAAQLAVQSVNAGGGVGGRQLELVVADDGGQPDSAVAAAAAMVNQQGCLALMGTLLSHSRLAVAEQVAAPHRVPLLNFSFYEGGIADPWFFNFAAVPNQQIESLIPYLMSRFGGRFYFAGNNYEWPRGSIDAAKRTVTARGGEVVGEEYLPFAPSAEQVAELIDDVLSSGAQVFVPYFAGLDQVGVLRAAHAAGLGDMVGVGLVHFDPVLASMLTPAERDGLIVANTYFMSVQTDMNEKVLAQLRQWPGVTGLWPDGNGVITNFGEAAWECVEAFAEAARAAPDLTPESLASALETVTLWAPQGTVVMDPATHHAAVNCYVAETKASGEFTVVARAGLAAARVPERFLAGLDSIAPDLTEDDSGDSGRASGAVLIVDFDGVIKAANRSAAAMFGYSAEELVGTTARSLVPPHLRRGFVHLFEDFVRSDQSERVLARRSGLSGYRKDGTYFDIAATVGKHSVDGQDIMVASLTDIRDVVQARQRRHRLITHDPLTGLMNRALFLVRLDSALRRGRVDGRHVLLASVDIDGLDTVNRRFGSGAGDAVLVEVARRLSRAVSGSVVARISDDRFALFVEVPTTAESRAKAVADVAAATNREVEFAGHAIAVSGTLGVAGDTAENSAEELLTQAEAAMYDAKTTARGGWRFYEPNQQRLAERRHTIDGLLRDPMLEAQLLLNFQPIVSLSIDEFIGAEVLLRWQSPIGPIGPAEFIPIAESNGTIIRIGRWVVERSLHAMAQFKETFGAHNPMLSINVSPQQLPHVARQFAEVLKGLQIDATEVLVEVTESGLDSLDEGVNSDLAAIKALGLGVAIDDFGTGTSGLAVVSRMNIDTLKIDRGFVDGAFALPRRRKLLGAIVSMAHALGLSVIAEGVENERDLEFLKSVGCDAAQGYLLAKPMPIEEFEAAWQQSVTSVH